jgi:outer membrane protein assembly factor BamB
MFKQKTQVLLLVGLAALCGAVTLHAQDWTQWRGANRDGAVQGFAAPQAWPEKLKLVWKTPVGAGYASPLVVKNRAWVFSRQDEAETITAVSLDTGKVLWSKSYAVPFKKNQYAVQMGKGPHATPVYYQGRLYTFGVNATLSCFDAITGKLLWQKDFGVPDTSKMFCGSASSPVVENGAVIVHTGDDVRGGLLTAFDAKTGQQRWQLKCDGPGYASPVVANLSGTRQLVTMTDKSVIGVNVKSGGLLWSLHWPDEWNENIVTPLLHKGLVILSGVRKGTAAVRVTNDGGKWAANEVWRNAEIAMYMNSPVSDGANLYGMSAKRKGQYFCLEAATGRVWWTTEGREGDYASLQIAPGLLFILNSDANLTIVRTNTEKFDSLAKYKVADSPTYAHPVVLGRRILIKDDAHLALWSF